MREVQEHVTWDHACRLLPEAQLRTVTEHELFRNPLPCILECPLSRVGYSLVKLRLLQSRIQDVEFRVRNDDDANDRKGRDSGDGDTKRASYTERPAEKPQEQEAEEEETVSK